MTKRKVEVSQTHGNKTIYCELFMGQGRNQKGN